MAKIGHPLFWDSYGQLVDYCDSSNRCPVCDMLDENDGMLCSRHVKEWHNSEAYAEAYVKENDGYVDWCNAQRKRALGTRRSIDKWLAEC